MSRIWTTFDFAFLISLPFEPAQTYPKSVMSMVLLRKYIMGGTNWG